MRGSVGQLLIQQGVIDASALSDALARQSGRHPVASELYSLGYARERDLALALSVQTGWPAVVLDESVIRLEILENVTLEWARIFSALVVYEDAQTLVVACARPEDAIVPARELGASRGKNVELRIALDITLARTIRIAFDRYRAGETYLVGPEARRTSAFIAVVAPDNSDHDEHRQAQRALAEEAARSIMRDDELPLEEFGGNSRSTTSADWHVSTITTENEADDQVIEERTVVLTDTIDRSADADVPNGHTRVMIVDPDPPGRIHLFSELERLGYECQSAGTAEQAVDVLSQQHFDIVFADIATPDFDGLRACRAIKRSKRLGRCKVVVTTSVVDSGQIPDALLKQHGADGYLEKPVDPRRLHQVLRDLSTERPGHEALLAEALGRYHGGDIDGAIAGLRGALVGDPASPKLHFMLGNMLQRASRWNEAVDEYESVVDLQPSTSRRSRASRTFTSGRACTRAPSRPGAVHCPYAKTQRSAATSSCSCASSWRT